MIIERDIRRFCVVSDDSIASALSRIDAQREGFVLVIDDSGVLEGMLTDGDVRRWLLKESRVDMNQPVSTIVNRDCTTAQESESDENIGRLLSSKIKFVPILDNRRRLISIARRRSLLEGVRVGDRFISDETPVFVIAEIGINHNGSEETACRLINAACEARVDAVKFQMRHVSALYRTLPTQSLTAEDLSAQYTLNLLAKFELSTDVMLRLFDYAKARGVIPLCTPWEEESLRVLEEYGMPVYKVASADLTNHPFLRKLAKTHKPLLLSTGMANEHEILASVKLLKQCGASYALLHCNSTYPAPFKDVNLRYLPHLKKIGGCPVGYSGHERGTYIAVAAVCQGACIIEKHITLDRSLEGTDHRASLLPDEFKSMIEGVRQVEASLGSGQAREMSQGEMMNRSNLAKSLIAGCEIKEGDVIDESKIEIRSPGRGLQPNRLSELVGRRAKHSFTKGDFFFDSDIEQRVAIPRPYHFSRPWGLTVRWHDFKTIMAQSNPNFLEFHLSVKDMDEDFLKFFDAPLDLDLKVHSPDTFNGDHLLDLANPNDKHRSRSIKELQRVIDLTRALKPFFKQTKRPMIIASLGGFSTDGFLSQSEVKKRYQLLAASYSELDSDGVEIIGQTLPPFPWYFGGQMYLNLFVKPEDTAEFCRENGLRLCFDISHSKLACNHFKFSFANFVDVIAPHAAHLHMADARGVDGEGLQVGEGDIDFVALCRQLHSLCPTASFMPEIWQGHKNHGEGFWTALERLEKITL